MADQFDPNGKASFLSASVSDKGERGRNVRERMETPYGSIRDECKVLT